MNIIKSASTALHKTGFKLKEHSPEILAVTGVVSVLGSVVMACRATIKAQDILDDTKRNLEAVHVCVEEKYETYTEEDRKKDLALIYTQSAVKMAKTYAPAVVMLGLGLGCLLKSNDILRKRNVAIAAAYATIDKSFKEYRERVVDRFGEDIDNELRYNIKAKEVTEEVTDPETGETTTVSKTVYGPEGTSGYAKFFDESSREWKKAPGYNYMFLKQQLNWFNRKLVERGHVFLFEIYDALDIPRTPASMIVGWVYDLKNPHGDNVIKFIGLDELESEASRAFTNGHEKNVLLDFNVDGVIYDIVSRYDFSH